MFEFDIGKLILFGVVALIVVGPNELPVALRAAARILAKIKGVRDRARRAAEDFISEVSLDDRTMQNHLGMNFATAMRGRLPDSGEAPAHAEIDKGALDYASPEMRAYLAAPEEIEETPRETQPAEPC